MEHFQIKELRERLIAFVSGGRSTTDGLGEEGDRTGRVIDDSRHIGPTI